MSAHVSIEGGESKEDQIRCREGFRKLFQRAGFRSRMPRLTASGSRNAAYDDFQTAHAKSGAADFVALLVDSEDPLAHIEKTWEHLKSRDQWARPAKAGDEQVLLMTTSMETWIVGDREALRQHYGQKLQETALPPLFDLENRNRHEVHDKLAHASRDCSNAYSKGKRSFLVVGMLDPTVLMALPSFARAIRILKAEL